MHEDLDQVKRILRAERCPDRVLANVQTAISRERTASAWSAQRRLIGFAAAAILVLVVSMARWFPARSPVSMPDLQTESHPTFAQAKVVDQAQLSLACIGSALIETGRRTETIVVNQINPRLLSGLEKAVNALANP